MRSSQIHPRLLARIRKVRENRQGEVLDTRVRVYSRHCKAVKRLNKSRHPADPEAAVVCARSAQAIRQLARQHRPPVDQDPPADLRALTKISSSVQPGSPGNNHAQIPGDETDAFESNDVNLEKESDRFFDHVRLL